MTRTVRGVDRTLATLLGLVLLAVGVAGVLWWTGTLAGLWSGTPDAVDAGAWASWRDASWWGAAATATGVVLAALAVWWLAAHLASPRVGTLRLPGSGADGALDLDPAAVCRYVTGALADEPGVRRARLRLEADPAPHVLVGRVDVDPEADVAAVAARTRELVQQARDVLDLPDLRARVRVAVTRRAGGTPRVR